MVFSISDFSANISKLSPARLNKYSVMITPPAELNLPISEDITLLCDSANLPGASIGLDMIRHKGYGLDEKRPNTISFDDITLTIIADGQGRVLDFLQKWVNHVFSHDEENDNPDSLEMFNYPQEYWGALDIYLYDITAKMYMTYTMKMAYPINIGGIQMGWDQNDQLMRIPVTFTFRNYVRNKSDVGFNNPTATEYMNINATDYGIRIV